ncbi:DUF4124 domain-containing protein [uncultured Deefgea sp.]|uniref:DUF4124 domain-containing protein n=1 Tax=uncultured Deefgea sp. TaxID=1304914 RepID=UPI00260B2846|nr:DUF4124 domain-containing protein [uncultured Deefgea sp.]
MHSKRLIGLLFLCNMAHADIYKYVDSNGNVTFTNSPIKGAVRIMSESQPAANPIRRNNESVKSPRVAVPSPVNFPKVDAATQKTRDSNRKLILEEELSSERELFNKAKKNLQEADANRSAAEQANPKLYLDRIGRLREAIVMHEKNVTALQAELTRVR